MKLEHHYTLTITCQAPFRPFGMGGGGDIQVVTIHGDYETLHEVLGDLTRDASVVAQLERFEASLNADDGTVAGPNG